MLQWVKISDYLLIAEGHCLQAIKIVHLQHMPSPSIDCLIFHKVWYFEMEFLD